MEIEWTRFWFYFVTFLLHLLCFSSSPFCFCFCFCCLFIFLTLITFLFTCLVSPLNISVAFALHLDVTLFYRDARYTQVGEGTQRTTLCLLSRVCLPSLSWCCEALALTVHVDFTSHTCSTSSGLILVCFRYGTWQESDTCCSFRTSLVPCSVGCSFRAGCLIDSDGIGNR